jgi:pimeloyl-ACP methyl ester carboxylesterase
MRRQSIAKNTAKISLFTVFGLIGLVGASTIGAVISAWVMGKPSRKKELDCIGRIKFGKLEPVSLMTSDGVKLHAWMQLSSRAASSRWVIILHGYRSNREVLQTRRRFFVRRGYHVLLVHFRGHGGSEAARISYGFNERWDVKAAVDFIRSLHPGRPVEIGIDGVSMGAAAATFAVAYESVDPDWIIVESCYNDIRRALANRLQQHVASPLVPIVSGFVKFAGEYVFRLPLDDLNPGKALEKIRCPVLVLAGDSEKVLKAAEVELLYQNIPGPKRLVFFPGATHEDLLVYDPRRYIRAVTGFLRELSPRQSVSPEDTPAYAATLG